MGVFKRDASNAHLEKKYQELNVDAVSAVSFCFRPIDRPVTLNLNIAKQDKIR